MTCCCVNINDFEAPAVYEKTKVKARKPHWCCECTREIPAGASYWLVEGLWDGHWERYRTCELCESVADDRLPCGYIFGELWESIRECLREHMDDDMSWASPPTTPIEVKR